MEGTGKLVGNIHKAVNSVDEKEKVGYANSCLEKR